MHWLLTYAVGVNDDFSHLSHQVVRVACVCSTGYPSRVAGVSEVIEDGTCAYLIEPDDGEAMASLIVQSLSHQEQLSRPGKTGVPT